MVSKKTFTRLILIQIMYQEALTPSAKNLKELTENTLNAYLEINELTEKKNINESFLNELHKTFNIHQVQIDEILTSYCNKSDSFEKLTFILRNILRLGITELKFYPDTPAKVIINEYTNLASEFLTLNETGFVNSLLNKFAHESRTIL